MNEPFSGHTATLLPSGQVLVIGNPDGGFRGDAELYEPGTGQWTNVSPTTNHVAWTGQTATLLDSGDVLVAGTRTPPQAGAQFPYDLAEFFAPGTALWSSAGSHTFRNRTLHTANRLPSGSVLVVGGYCVPQCSGSICNNDCPSTYAGGALFTPDAGLAGAWADIASPSGFFWHSATTLQSGDVLVVGGIPATNTGVLSSKEAFRFEASTGDWVDGGVASLHQARDAHTATLLTNGQVIVVGGEYRFGIIPFRTVLASVESYEPDAGTWTVLPSLHDARAFHTATLLPSGKVLVTGGAGTSVELFDPATGQWSKTASMLVARASHTATLLTSGKVLVAGGVGSDGEDLSSAEIYFPLTANPWTSTVFPRQTVSLTASGGSGSGYSWTLISNGSNGTLEASTGRYTAGASGNTTDVVQLTDGALETVRATLRVGPGVSISPSALSVPPRQSQDLGVSGGSGTGYAWTFVSNGSGATLDASTGLYTAGSTGSTTDVVAATDSVGNTAALTITVTSAVTIEPPSVTLQPKSSRAFSASGGSGTGFGWTLAQNGSGATLNGSSGVYTAGAAAGTDIVEVTDSLGNAAQATVTVAGGAASQSGGCGGSSTTAAGPLPWLILMLLPLLARRTSRSD